MGMYPLKAVITMKDFESIINDVALYHKIFDVIRLVDPIKKEVLYTKKGLSPTSERLTTTNDKTCYSFWSKGQVCNNCISMRALTERKSFVKFEYMNAHLFMTTVLPLDAPHDAYVVELITDVTQSELIGQLKTTRMADIYETIEDSNKALITDPLTGLYNRRFLQERLPYELANNNLKAFDSAILMIDLDHFKKINDDFGHIAGDKILKDFSTILGNCIREDYDWIVRYGGEEFIVYLKNIKADNLDKVCEKIRAAVEKTTFKYEDHIIPITVSIGASHIKSTAFQCYEDILKVTDEQLYLAKQAGRNTFFSRVNLT